MNYPMQEKDPPFLQLFIKAIDELYLSRLTLLKLKVDHHQHFLTIATKDETIASFNHFVNSLISLSVYTQTIASYNHFINCLSVYTHYPSSRCRNLDQAVTHCL